MTSLQIAHRRLHSQHLSSPRFKKSVDVVQWLGAVQAQDYYGAKWALSSKMRRVLLTFYPHTMKYLVAYKDRSPALDPINVKYARLGNSVFSQAIVLGGQVIGSWQRTVKNDSVTITLKPFAPLGKAETNIVAEAAERYGAFLGLTVKLS